MPQVTGDVTKINIKGYKQNSAQLLFVVNGKPFVVTAYPEFEPQVFVAMATLVSGAFYAGKKVTVSYLKVTGETSRAIEITVS